MPPRRTCRVNESPNRPAVTAERQYSVRLRRPALSLSVLAVLSLSLGIQAARIQLVLAKSKAAPAAGAIPPSSPASFSLPVPDAEKIADAEILRLAPQQQAERLLERAMHQPEPSLDLIREHVDAWRGRVQSTDQLFRLVLAALKSEDPRVRAAAVEIDLASSNLAKSPQSVDFLERQLKVNSPVRSLALWRLGALGNRGVQPARVLGLLLIYAHDRDLQSRYWAVEGMAMLGTDASIGPLLSILTHDPSLRVRERAACSLSQSGMLTHEQRLSVIPDLLNLVDDDSLNSTTRGLIYNSLRVITGAKLENDPDAWRNWWAHRDIFPKPPHRRFNLTLA
jgi:HEAT repeat protein